MSKRPGAPENCCGLVGLDINETNAAQGPVAKSDSGPVRV